MPTKFRAEIPVANALRFTKEGSANDERANFDQRYYSNVENATMEKRKYLQLAEKADIFPVEFYSNYPAQRVQVIDCDENVLQTYVPTKLVEYRNKTFRTSCLFISMNDKLFVYFQTETEFTDEDFTIPGDTTAYDGTIPPINVQEGDIVRYKIGALDIEVADVLSIEWNSEVKAEGYLLDVDATILTPVAGAIEFNYNEKEVDLYIASVAWNDFVLNDSIVFVRILFGITTSSLNTKFISEPVYLKTKHKESLLLKYRHNGTYDEPDKWNFVYTDGMYCSIRFPAMFYQVAIAGELDADTDDTGVQRIIRSVPYRQLLFKILNVPGWIVDKLLVIFSHDEKIINEYQWEIENYGSVDNIEQVDLPTLEINLRQVNDRTKYVTEEDIEITAAFDPDELNAIFEGEELETDFLSNTSSTFRFLNLPDWITADPEEFTNGQTVTLTIAENETAADRSITLVAKSDDFDLTAELQVNQAHDTSIIEYLEVDTNPVNLLGNAGADQVVNVNSSGDYDITFGGAHTFTAVKESGFTQVRISESTANNDDEPRTGTVTLTLQSNPSIFVVINVTQAEFDAMFGVSPAIDIIDGAGGEKIISVLAASTAQWQAISDQSGPPATGFNDWLHFDKTIQTGPKPSFSINVDAKPPYISPRIGVVTFYNIFNPADAVTYTITQND